MRMILTCARSPYYATYQTAVISYVMCIPKYRESIAKDDTASSSVEVGNWKLNLGVSPLTPKSDQRLISPYSIIAESHNNFTRIKDIITN